VKKITEFNTLVGDMLFPGVSVYCHFLEAAVFVAQGRFFPCSHTKKLHFPYLPDLAIWVIKLSAILGAKVSFFLS